MKPSFHQTLRAILRVEVVKRQILFRGEQLPNTRYKRKKRAKLARKHHGLPLASFFSNGVIDYRWNAADRRNEATYLLLLPAPVSLRLHHSLDRIKRDVAILYNFLNENNLNVSFMPARYVTLGFEAPTLHSGYIHLRNFQMYTVYSQTQFLNFRESTSLEFNTDIHTSLQSSLLIPSALYYCITEGIPLDYQHRFSTELDFDVFENFNSYKYSIVLEQYKQLILLINGRVRKCVHTIGCHHHDSFYSSCGFKRFT